MKTLPEELLRRTVQRRGIAPSSEDTRKIHLAAMELQDILEKHMPGWKEYAAQYEKDMAREPRLLLGPARAEAAPKATRGLLRNRKLWAALGGLGVLGSAGYGAYRLNNPERNTR